MALDANRDGLTVGVLGAGAMGRGIAQVAAVGGCTVRLFDTKEGAGAEAVAFIDGMLKRAADKGRMDAADAAAATARISDVAAMDDFAGCDVVIEAVIERLDVKHAVFQQLEAIVGPDVVLASNTSSLPVTAIAAACEHPGRVAGLHFFNPVPLMRLVEVISGVKTEPAVADFLMDLGRRFTREPVRVGDAPGFLVNQVGRGFTVEASHIVHEGVAEFVEIDRIMREAGGFRMGPFELMDLTGLDVTQPASEQIYGQFFHEARYRPSVVMKSRQTAGLYGRKTKAGFYVYEDGKQQVPEEAPAPAYDGRPVWVSAAEEAGHKDVSELVAQLGGTPDRGDTPGADSLILVTPLGLDATTAAVNEALDAKRTVAVDTFLGLDRRRTLMKTPVTDQGFTDAAQGLFSADGTPATVIRDCPGFVTQRIISSIVNIGCSIAQQGTAVPADIDKAVTLGLGYPNGPLGFGDAVGPDRVLTVLTNMQAQYGDPRYRPSPWLRRRAQLGLSLLTSEN